MVPGNRGGDTSLLPQHFLRLQEAATLGHHDFGSGGHASHWPLHGQGSPANQVSDPREGLLAQPWSLQHQGARPHFHIRQRRRRVWEWRRLCRRDCRYNPRLLRPEDYLPGRLAPCSHHAGMYYYLRLALNEIENNYRMNVLQITFKMRNLTKHGVNCRCWGMDGRG